MNLSKSSERPVELSDGESSPGLPRIAYLQAETMTLDHQRHFSRKEKMGNNIGATFQSQIPSLPYVDARHCNRDHYIPILDRGLHESAAITTQRRRPKQFRFEWHLQRDNGWLTTDNLPAELPHIMQV